METVRLILKVVNDHTDLVLVDCINAARWDAYNPPNFLPHLDLVTVSERACVWRARDMH